MKCPICGEESMAETGKMTVTVVSKETGEEWTEDVNIQVCKKYHCFDTYGL